MKFTILLGSVLLASPAIAQKKPSASPVDPCAPIGRTADGKLVFSLKCDNLPAPPPRAEAAPAPVEEEDKGGLFRNPFPSLVRPAATTERMQGVGPPPAPR